MPTQAAATTLGLAGHGAGRLTAVHIDTYNAELRDDEGFIGDRASGRAFRAILDDARERVLKGDEDPIGDVTSTNISKKKLDRLIVDGDPLAAGVVLDTIEDFAQEFATVIRRIMHLEDWRGTQRIVVGGGLRASRIGELAIGRAAALLKAASHDVELQPIRHDPDEAGLIGCIHLAPSWIFSGHDSILAVDIGGSNIRVGVVELNQAKATNLSRSKVGKSELWRHADDKPSRKDAVERMTEMLLTSTKRATKRGLRLAPFIGIGCPGLIREDGSIEKGGKASGQVIAR
jgi:predicted NBD/HSP70 family sugar kinase